MARAWPATPSREAPRLRPTARVRPAVRARRWQPVRTLGSPVIVCFWFRCRPMWAVSFIRARLRGLRPARRAGARSRPLRAPLPRWRLAVAWRAGATAAVGVPVGPLTAWRPATAAPRRGGEGARPLPATRPPALSSTGEAMGKPLTVRATPVRESKAEATVRVTALPGPIGPPAATLTPKKSFADPSLVIRLVGPLLVPAVAKHTGHGPAAAAGPCGGRVHCVGTCLAR